MGNHDFVYVNGVAYAHSSGTRAGIGVWWGERHRDNVSCAVKGRKTINCAEIEAATIAVTKAWRRGLNSLTIFTHSKFLVDCQQKWVKNWETNGWLTKTGSPVINKIELQELNEKIRNSNIFVMYQLSPRSEEIVGSVMANKAAKRAAREDNSGNQRSVDLYPVIQRTVNELPVNQRPVTQYQVIQHQVIQHQVIQQRVYQHSDNQPPVSRHPANLHPPKLSYNY